jgi:type I restriction enzyme M protein
MLLSVFRMTRPLATSDAFKDIEKLEADLWAAADNLRANSKLTSSAILMSEFGIKKS